VRRPVALSLGGTALLIGLVLRGVLDPTITRLPGIDSHNLFTWEVYTRSVLADGHVPLWNPYHFAGLPHLADPQTTVFYPPAFLLRWLPVPAYLGWMMALHLWIAAAGTLFAARVLGVGWLAASASAIGVMLGSSVPGWIHGGQLLPIYTVAWVPWVIGLAVVSLQSGRIWPDPRLIGVLVLQFLSGYLQGTLYVAAALTLYYLFSVLWPDGARRWVPIAQLAVLSLLCAAVAAFQLLPTMALVSEAGRSTGMLYRDALEGSWQPLDLATLLYPFYGIIDGPPHRMLTDRLAYAGWILTLFAPFAFFTRERLRMAVFLGLLALVTLALALGDAGGLFRLQHSLFPGLRVPSRALFLTSFSLAMLGAIGLESFLALARERRWSRMALPAVLACTGAAAATLAVLDTSTLRGPGWPWMPAVLVAGVLTTATAALFRSRQLALTVALAVVVLDMTSLGLGAVATTPVETDADIRSWIGPPAGGRAISLCENVIGAREFLQNGEPTLDGAASLHLREYADWAFLAKTGDVPPGGGLYRRIGSEGLPPARDDLIDMANVTRVVECHGPDGQPSAVTVQANDGAWPRAVWVCGADEVPRSEAIARVVRGRYDSSGLLQPRHYIKLRWMPTVDAARRAALEKVHHLQNGVIAEGVTWRYLLGNASTDAVLAIVRDPEVEDTSGVDRGTGAFMPTGELMDSVREIAADDRAQVWLPQEKPCPQQASVTTTVMDQSDGHVEVRVDAPSDGFLFLSEPYYRERHAYVDGAAAPALKANLTFTAVAVPAGQHVVELRYSPERFYLGSAISGATAGCLAIFYRRRKGTLP
jgi:hypothetical protein